MGLWTSSGGRRDSRQIFLWPHATGGIAFLDFREKSYPVDLDKSQMSQMEMLAKCLFCGCLIHIKMLKAGKMAGLVRRHRKQLKTLLN